MVVEESQVRHRAAEPRKLGLGPYGTPHLTHDYHSCTPATTTMAAATAAATPAAAPAAPAAPPAAPAAPPAAAAAPPAAAAAAAAAAAVIITTHHDYEYSYPCCYDHSHQ